MKKKLAVEVFMTAVVIFDAAGYYSYHLPVWPFLPMWAGAMLEVEVGARVLTWLSRHLHVPWIHRPKGTAMA